MEAPAEALDLLTLGTVGGCIIVQRPQFSSRTTAGANDARATQDKRQHRHRALSRPLLAIAGKDELMNTTKHWRGLIWKAEAVQIIK